MSDPGHVLMRAGDRPANLLALPGTHGNELHALTHCPHHTHTPTYKKMLLVQQSWENTGMGTLFLRGREKKY